MRDWSEVAALAAALPEMAEATSYGTPALKVGRKLVTRLREDRRSLVLFDVPHDEREFLIEAEPEVFFLTPHYADYRIVLGWLDAMTPERLFPFIERRWRACAPKRALRAYGE